MRGTRPFVPSSPLALAIGSVLGIALPGAVWGGQSTITTPVGGDRDLGTQVINPGDGNVYDVRSGRTRGHVDFNSFGRFEVAHGDTVNLHLSSGATTVVNLVWDARALIDGTLNSLKDGAVGGRVVFADTHGLVVGSSGVLNVGSLAVATPTAGFMDRLVSGNSATVDAATGDLLGGVIPLSNGTVDIHGRINARDDVRIQARAVDVTGTVWVTGGTGADTLQSTVAVNTGAGDGIRMVNDGGNILLVASDDLTVSGTLHADGGDILLQADDQVRLAAGAVVNTRDLSAGGGDLVSSGSEGASGAVLVAGRDIGVANGASIHAHATGAHAAGDITIEAADRVQVQTGLARGASRVAVDGSLRGQDITLTATTIADADWVDPNASLATMAGSELVDFAQQAGTAIGGAIGFMATDTRAEVAVGTGAVLDARGDIDLQALTRQSIRTTVTGLRGDDQIQSVLGLGALYAGIGTVASAQVADGATITADGALDVSARTDNTLDVSVTSFAVDGTAAAMTLALSDVDVSADARIGDGATLQVGRLGVSTLNESNLSTSATAHADDDGAVGLAAAISLQDIEANAFLARDITASGAVVVEAASLATRNATTARVLGAPSSTSSPSSSAGGGADGGNAVAGLLGKGFHALSGKLGEQGAGNDSQDPTPPPFRLGSAMTYTTGSHSAAARIDDGVRVRAGGDVTVHADVVDAGIAILARSLVDAKGDNPDEPGSPYSLSAGVALTDLRHDAVAEVGADAGVEAARIGVGSNVSLPMDLSQLGAAVPDFSSLGALMSSLSAAKDVVKKPWELFTSYAGATSKAEDAAIGGTINHFRVSNRSRAWIGDGARLTSTAAAGTAPAWSSALAGDARSADWTQSIAVRAATDSRSLHSAGELGLGLPVGVGQGGAAVGGSFNNIVYDTVTAAGIARDAVVTSANGVDVDASTHDTAVSLALMAGSGGSIGISGTMALLDVDSTTHASVSRDAEITAAALGVDAMQDLFVWSVSGALAMSDSLSVGLGVGVHNLRTDTRAFIGDNRTDAPDATGAVQPVTGVTGTGQVAVDALSVQARSQGMAGAVAVAGAVAKSSAPAAPDAKPGVIDRLKTSAQTRTDGLRNQAADRFTGLPLLGGLADKVRGEQNAPPAQQQPSEPKFGITVSGSSSVNLVSQDARAELDGARVSGRSGASTTLDVAAINDTTLASASGSAAITLAKADSSKFSAAIGGAVSFSQVDNDTAAGIGDSVVSDAREVAVHALSGGEQTNVALGVSVNKSTDQTTATSVVGSFSVGRSSNDTRAWLDRSTLSGGSVGNRVLDVGAYGRTHVGVGGGSLYFGGRGGVGAAFTYAEIGDTTSASIDGGSVSDYDDVSLRALDAARIIAGAAMAGGGSDSNGLSGAVVYNNVDNVTRARIAGGATLDVDGDLLVQARSTAPVQAFEDRLRAVISDPAEGFDYRGGALSVDVDGVDADLANAGNSIIAVAGLVQAGKNNIGLSFVGNEVDNVHAVEIANAQLDVGGAARLDAADSTAILGLGFGVGVATGKFAGMGNATANMIGNRTQVLVGDAGAVNDNTRIDAGSLHASAVDASFIGSLAGNVAIGSKAALGAAVTWNDIGNLTSVDVVRSQLDSRGAVTLAADNQATILAGAVAGAVGNNAAISGSFGWSEIGNTTRASLADSRVAAGGLDVRADSSSDIFTLSGAIAASGTAAVGAAINIASIEDSTEAVVEDVRIAVDDDVTVAAAGTGVARSLAVAGVASNNVAVGGSSSTALVDNTIAARVSGLQGLASDGAGADRLQVTADNTGTAETLAGAVSAGSSVAIGGALSVNHVGGETSATLADSVLAVRDQVAVEAYSDALVNTVAGTGSASSVGIAGAATTNVITASTRATLADTALDSTTTGTRVVAVDSSQINSVAGSLGFGSNVGVGAAVAVNVIDRNVDAQVLGGAQNRRYHGRDLLVRAEANNDGALDGGNINTIAAGVGGGGTVGGAASVAVNVINGGVSAEIGQSADVVAEHSIGVIASNTQGINVFAGSLGIGGSAAGIGLGTVVNVMDASTEARVHGSGTQITALGKSPGQAIVVDAGDLADPDSIAVSSVQAAEDYVSPDLSGTTTAVNGLAVNASTRQHVATLGVSGAVSFNPIAGTSLAAMAGVNVVGGQTRALIEGAQINQHAGAAGSGQQVDVRASSHSVGANFIAGIAAGAGVSGAGAVATNVFDSGTQAGIAGATVDARDAVTVDATSSQHSLVVAAGLAGGLAGGAGTGVVNVFQSSTDAFVRGGAIDAGALTIDAETANAASLVGGAVSVGAMAVSGTLMVNVSETSTRAALEGTDVDTDGDVAVRAHSDTGFQGVAVSGAFAGGNALAGMAQVNVIGNFTEAAVRGADIDAGGGVDVEASELLALRAYSGALGVGLSGGAGVGAGANVAVLGSRVRAAVVDSDIDAGGELDVRAAADRDIEMVAMTAGAGMSAGIGGGAGLLLSGVGSIGDSGSELGTTFAGLADLGASDKFDAGIVGGSLDAGQLQRLDSASRHDLTGAMNGRTDQVVAVVSGSTVDADGVSVAADNQLSSRNLAGGLGLGGVGVGGAFAFTGLYGQTRAGIGNSTVEARGDISVDARTRDGAGGASARVEAYAGGAGLVGLGAAVAVAQVDQDVSAEAGGTLRGQGGRVQVAVRDSGSIDVDAIGAAAGAAAVGIVVADARRSSTVEAALLAGSTVNGFNRLLVDASGTGAVSAYGLGAAGGILAAGTGVGVTARDDSGVLASIGNGAAVDVTGGGVDVRASARPDVSAEGLGAAASGAVALGAVIVDAGSAAAIDARVGDSVVLAGSGGLRVSALADHAPGEAGIRAKSTAGTGGVFLSANAATARAHNQSRVVASTGDALRLPDGDVAVTARNLTAQEAEALGVAVGGFAVGAVVVEAESDTVTRATLGGGAVHHDSNGAIGHLTVDATGVDRNAARAVAGSGGIVSGNAAVARTRSRADVDAVLGSGAALVATGDIRVKADHDARYAGQADSTNAAVIGGSGAQVFNDAGADVHASVGAAASVLAGGDIELRATNRYNSDLASGEIAVQGAAGGVISGSSAGVTTNLQGTTTAAVGAGADLLSGLDPYRTLAGDISVVAATIANTSDTASLSTGGAIDVARVSADLRADFDNTVRIGDNAWLSSQGYLNLGTYTRAFHDASALVNTWGLAAVGVADSDVSIDSMQTVDVGAGSLLESLSNSYVTAGRDATGLLDSLIQGNSVAEGYVRGLIAVPDASASVDVTSNASTLVGDGAAVLGASNVTAGAYTGETLLDASGVGRGYQLGFIPVTQRDSSSDSRGSGQLTVDGTLLAGRYNELDISIDANGVLTQHSGLAVGATRDTAFRPRDFLDHLCTGGNDSDGCKSLAALRNSVAPGAVNAWTLGPMFAAGGDVFLHGTTIGGTGAVTAQGAPSIRVVNNSNHYLLLDRIQIPDYEGGRVRYTGVAGSAPSLAVSEAPGNARPTVFIHNAGQGSDGPAIFAMEDIRNIGGLVHLRNDQGSLGQFGTVSAQQQIVEAPNGIVTFANLNADWFSGSDPQADWRHLMLKPTDANDTVAYIANAVYGNSGDLTRRLLHREPIYSDEAGSSIVLFGACLPHYNSRCSGGPYGGTRDFYFGDEGGQMPLVPLRTLAKSIAGYGDNSVVGANASAFRGQQIYVRARYIDVNSTIDAGAGTDWSVRVVDSPALQTWLAARDVIGSGRHEIPPQYLDAIGADSRRIRAWYDAANGRIVVDNVNASGGGYVYLDGKIVSTTPHGTIKVSSGFGEVRVDSLVDRTVELQDINVGNGAIGVVEIVDREKGTAGNPLVTWYVSRQGEAAVAFDNRLGARSYDDANAFRLDNAGVYNPQAGMRYGWTESGYVRRNVTRTDGIISDVGNWYWTNSNGQVVDAGQQWFTSNAGFYRGTAGGPVFEQNITGVFWDVQSQGINYGCRSQGGSCNYGFPVPPGGGEWNPDRNGGDGGWQTSWRYQFPTRGEVNLNASVKADNAIAIDFSGASQGLIDVDARGDLLLDGRLWNPDGTTRLTATATAAGGAGNIIGTSDTAMITTRGLYLEATGGIGIGREALQVTLTPGGHLVANTGRAGVALDVHSDAAVHINAGDASGYGDVELTASGNITGIAGRSHDISGRDISLHSLYGSVGSTLAPLVLRANETVGSDNSIDGGRVTATALNDIALRDLAGDFWVDSVVSEAGDVRLHAASGAVLDASLRTGADVLSEEQISRIRQSLRLDGSGIGDSVSAFERQVEARYQEYWRLRGLGVVDGGVYAPGAQAVALFRGLAEAAAGEQGLSDAQVRDYITARYATLEGFFDDNLGVGWAARGEFQQYDAGFAYAVAAGSQQYDDLSRNAVWTDAQLRYAINASALEPSAGGVGAAEPTVSGRNVHLQAATAIGRLANDLDIDYLDLQLGKLDSEQALALALANTPGDVLMIGADGEVLTRAQLLALSDADIANGAIASIRIKRTSPLFVQATGRLDGQAGGNAYLQARGDLRAGTFVTGGDARLAASGSIVDAAPGDGAAITVGGDLVLAAGNGGIGGESGLNTLDQALAVNVAGRLLSASAGQNVLIRQTSGDLRIGTVFANGLAALAVDDGGLHGTLDGVSIDARTIALSARDDIGRRDDGTTAGLDGPLQLRVASNGQLDGDAGGQVWVSSPDRALNIGALRSGLDLDVAVAGGSLRADALASTGGSVNAVSDGDMLLGSVDAHDLAQLSATRDLEVTDLVAARAELVAGRDLVLDQADVAGRLDAKALGEAHLRHAAKVVADAVVIDANALTMGADSAIVAADTIDIEVDGDMQLGRLEISGTDAGARIDLRAGGRIDGNADAFLHVAGGANVAADLAAGLGIGGGGAPLRVSVGLLDGRSDAGDIHLQLPDGGRIGSLTATDGHLAVDAGDALAFDLLAAQRALRLSGTDAQGTTLRAGAEGLDADLTGTLEVALIEVAGDAALNTGAGLLVDRLLARGTLTADVGTALQFGTATVGTDATLASGRDMTMSALTVGGTLAATAGNDLVIDVADIGGHAQLRSTGSSRLGTAVIGGQLDAAAGTDFAADDLQVAGDALVDATDIAIVRGGVRGNASLASLATTTLGHLAVAGDLVAEAGSDLVATSLVVGGNAGLASGGATRIDTLDVTGAVTVQADGQLALDTATVGTDATLASGRDMTMSALTVGGTLAATAGNDLVIDVADIGGHAQLRSIGSTRLGTAVIGGQLDAAAGTDFAADDLQVAGDALVDATDIAIVRGGVRGNASLASLATTTLGHLAVAGDLVAEAGSDLVATSLVVGGNAGLASGGATRIDTLDVTGAVTVQADGQLALDTATVGGDATLASGRDMTMSALTVGGTLAATAGNDLVIDVADIGGHAQLRSIGSSRLGTAVIGGQLDAAAGTDFAADDLQVAGDALVDATDIAIVRGGVRGNASLASRATTTLGHLAVAGDLVAEAGSDLVATTLIVGGNAGLASGGATLDVTGAVTVQADGQLALDTATVGTDATLTSGQDMTMSALTVGSTLAAAAGNDLVIDVADIGGHAQLRSTGSSRLGTAVIGGHLDAAAGTDFAADDLQVAGDALVDATDIAIVRGGVRGNASLASRATTTLGHLAVAGDLVAEAGSDLVATTLIVGGNADVHAGLDLTLMAVEAGGALAADAGQDLAIDVATAVADAVLTGGRDIALGSIATGGLLDATAAQDVRVGDATVGATATVLAARDAGLGSLVAAGRVDIDAGRDLRFAALHSATEIAARARTGHVAGIDATAGTSLAIDAAGDIRFDTAVAGTRADLMAGHDVLGGVLRADATDVRVEAGHDIDLVDVSARRDVLLSAGNEIRLGNGRGGRDIAATSGSDVAFGALDAARDLHLRSLGGGIAGDAVRTGRNAALAAARSVQLEDAFVGNDFAVDAGSDVLLGAYDVGGTTALVAAGDIDVGAGTGSGAQRLQAGRGIAFGHIGGDAGIGMHAAGGAIDGTLLEAPTASLSARERIGLDLARIGSRLNLDAAQIDGRVERTSAGGGPLLMVLTGYQGGVARRVELSVDARDGWILDRLSAMQAELDTTARAVGIRDGWIAESMQLTTPDARIWMHNYDPSLRPADVQLTQPDRAFVLSQQGPLTYTDAYVVRYGEGHHVQAPNHLSSREWADIDYYGESALRFTSRTLQASAWPLQGQARHPFAAWSDEPVAHADPVEVMQGAVNTGISP